MFTTKFLANVAFSIVCSSFVFGTFNAEEVTCPEDGKNGQFGHPTYCDQYLNCWNGTSVVGHCEHGLLFNPNISSCDYPMNVDCEGKLDSRPPADDNGFCPDSYGTFDNPEHCGQFIICQGGSPTFFNCPPTLIYNSTLGVCVDGDSSCLPEPEQIEATTDNPDKETLIPADQPDPQSPPEQETSTETPIDINLETLKPIPPIGPNANSSNSVLFPVIPSWPYSAQVITLRAPQPLPSAVSKIISCPVGHSVQFVNGSPFNPICVPILA